MAILLKTALVRVSSVQIMQIRVQNRGKRVWKSRYDGDVSQAERNQPPRSQTVVDAPIDSSTPLQQIPPSPPHEDELMQQAEPAVVIIPTLAGQETDLVDIFLNKTDEENALPE